MNNFVVAYLWLSKWLPTINLMNCVIMTELTKGKVLWTSENWDKENPRAREMPQAD
jgi:hypothetical protein